MHPCRKWNTDWRFLNMTRIPTFWSSWPRRAVCLSSWVVDFYTYHEHKHVTMFTVICSFRTVGKASDSRKLWNRQSIGCWLTSEIKKKSSLGPRLQVGETGSWATDYQHRKRAATCKDTGDFHFYFRSQYGGVQEPFLQEENSDRKYRAKVTKGSQWHFL